MIRKITRGVSTVNGEKTISCTITNPNKVIVILNCDFTIGTSSGGYSSSAGSIYLKSVSANNIIVCGYGAGNACYEKSNKVDFSYQIIEFM